MSLSYQVEEYEIASGISFEKLYWEPLDWGWGKKIIQVNARVLVIFLLHKLAYARFESISAIDVQPYLALP